MMLVMMMVVMMTAVIVMMIVNPKNPTLKLKCTCDFCSGLVEHCKNGGKTTLELLETMKDADAG